MLKVGSSIINQLNALTLTAQFQFSSRARKIPNLHQRLKHYGKYPNKYKLVTRIRPPNLRDQNIEFPIRIPIRYRHIYRPTKPLFHDNTKDIKWQRLSPNQILLAFQNFQLLTHKQILTGLEYLSNVQGQQNHNWNEHPWINKAFDYCDKNFYKVQTINLMKHYYLMKKLNCKHEGLWKKIYARIQEEMYDLYPTDFEYLFLTYYKRANEVFSSEMKEKFLKLMEGRLREFKNSTVLTIFQIYLEQNRLDNYWLENVFISLFKHPSRRYTIQQVGQIFRFMMIVGHENNERLYENLYNKIMTYEYRSVEQVELLEDIVSQVKQIFTSHRVQPYLEFLRQQKQRLKLVKEQKKVELYDIVKQDLVFFMERRKLKLQQKTA